MTRAGVAVLVVLLAACGKQGPASDRNGERTARPAPVRVGRAPVAGPAVSSEGATPMAERVATIGLLNKRNGISTDLTMKPGEALRVGDAIVRLRACETTAPWEPEQLTGAFLQLDVQGTDERFRRVFSGWVYKETPSLNVVEHPVYDVWPKACAMTQPGAGPSTMAAPAASSASSAEKSGAGRKASPKPVRPKPSRPKPAAPKPPAPAPPPVPTAAANNDA